jgi:hypothetical protein
VARGRLRERGTDAGVAGPLGAHLAGDHRIRSALLRAEDRSARAASRAVARDPHSIRDLGRLGQYPHRLL